jgi:hypothetical protein
MNPYNNANYLYDPKFSPCSKSDVCKKFRTFGSCLQYPGTKPVYNGNICGNGIKEIGEQVLIFLMKSAIVEELLFVPTTRVVFRTAH